MPQGALLVPAQSSGIIAPPGTTTSPMNPHPGATTAPAGGQSGKGTTTAVALVTAAAHVNQPDAGGQESPLSSGRSDADLTREEKDRERIRLQELVKKFSKDAVKGVACQKIQLEDGVRRNAKC